MRSISAVAVAGVLAAAIAAAPSSAHCVLASDGTGDAGTGALLVNSGEEAFDLVQVTASATIDHVAFVHEVADLEQLRAGSSQVGLVTQVTFEGPAGATAVLRAESLPAGYPSTASLTAESRAIDGLEVVHDYDNDAIVVFVPKGAFNYVLGNSGKVTVIEAETRQELTLEYPTGHPAFVAQNSVDQASTVGGSLAGDGASCN